MQAGIIRIKNLNPLPFRDLRRKLKSIYQVSLKISNIEHCNKYKRPFKIEEVSSIDQLKFNHYRKCSLCRKREGFRRPQVSLHLREDSMARLTPGWNGRRRGKCLQIAKLHTRISLQILIFQCWFWEHEGQMLQWASRKYFYKKSWMVCNGSR